MQCQSKDVVLYIAGAVLLLDYKHLIECVRMIVISFQLSQNGDHNTVIEGRLRIYLGDYVLDRLEAEAGQLLDYLCLAHQLLALEGHQRLLVLSTVSEERERRTIRWG